MDSTSGMTMEAQRAGNLRRARVFGSVVIRLLFGSKVASGGAEGRLRKSATGSFR
jgi:hypothetical protein